MYSLLAEMILLRKKVQIMNPQIQSEKELTITNNTDITITETDALLQSGFTSDEIVSLIWLRNWYQTGGSDRVEVVRYLEFLKLLVVSGKMELYILLLYCSLKRIHCPSSRLHYHAPSYAAPFQFQVKLLVYLIL